MYRTIILLLCAYNLTAAFKCPSHLEDGQGKVKLTAISFEGGFTAKWETIDTNYVELVNLEWICYPNGTELKGDTTVLITLSDLKSGEANITVNEMPVECKLSGCYLDSDWGYLRSIETVVFHIQNETIELPSAIAPASTPDPELCICNETLLTKRSVDDDDDNTATRRSNSIHFYYIIGFLGIIILIFAAANVVLMIKIKRNNSNKQSNFAI